MTSQQDRIALEQRLRQVLGRDPATTLLAMFAEPGEMVTKVDLAALGRDLRTEMGELRTELRTEMGELRTEIGMLRTEMSSRYATKDDLLAVVNGFNETMSGHVRGFNEMMAAYVRTFIVVQAATVVGMSAILFGLLRLA